MRSVLRGLLRRGREHEKETPPPPLPSIQRANREAWTPAQQSQSLFFCLPPEIRHMILCAMFGDRTVHIDLRLRPRLYTVETAEGCSHTKFHAGYPPLLTEWDMGLRSGIDLRTKTDKKLAWRWYSCVCHHNRPGKVWAQPFDDTCLKGQASCRTHPGNMPEKCMVGAMGYLRSCKRAYNEGCLVLYQTNTVFIESAPLIDGLLRQGIDPGAPILTGPGIQLVRTLYLKVEFMLFYPNPEKAAEERSRFAQALDLLPRAFPDLQRLQLIFHGDMYNQNLPAPMNNVPELDEIVFEPLLKLKEKMALEELTVTFPCFVFYNLMELVPAWKSGEIATRYKEDNVYGLRGIRVWYPFNSVQDGKEQPRRGLQLKIGARGTFIWNEDGSYGVFRL